MCQQTHVEANTRRCKASGKLSRRYSVTKTDEDKEESSKEEVHDACGKKTKTENAIIDSGLNPCCAPFVPKSRPSALSQEKNSTKLEEGEVDEFAWMKMLYNMQTRPMNNALEVIPSRCQKSAETQPFSLKILNPSQREPGPNPTSGRSNSKKSCTNSKCTSKGGVLVSYNGPPPKSRCVGSVRDIRGSWGFIRDNRPEYAEYDLFFHLTEVAIQGGHREGVRRGSRVVYDIVHDQWHQQYEYAKVKAVSITIAETKVKGSNRRNEPKKKRNRHSDRTARICQKRGKDNKPRPDIRAQGSTSPTKP